MSGNHISSTFYYCNELALNLAELTILRLAFFVVFIKFGGIVKSQKSSHSCEGGNP